MIAFLGHVTWQSIGQRTGAGANLSISMAVAVICFCSKHFIARLINRLSSYRNYNCSNKTIAKALRQPFNRVVN